MPNQQLISVIIPCYNHGKYLDDAINSILEQTHHNVEILIIDDGSTDDYTKRKLQSINDLKVKVFHKENGHLSSARNFGFRKTNSEFVLTLDADDKFHSTFLERALPVLLSDEKIAVVSSWAKYFGEKNNIKHLSGGGLKEFLTSNNCTACALIRKSVWEEVGGYDENLKGFMDWEFYINITKRGYRIHIIQEPLFFYRAHGESMISGSKKRKPELFKYIYRKHEDVYARYVTDVLYKKEKDIAILKENLKRSPYYKLGRFLLYPLIKLKRKMNFTL